MLEAVHIMRTAFQSLDADGKVLSENFGIRVYGNENVAYCNFVPSREALLSMTQAELVDFARRTNDHVGEMVHFAENGGCPIFIDSEQIEEYTPIFK
jgi:hypothetical protein